MHNNENNPETGGLVRYHQCQLEALYSHLPISILTGLIAVTFVSIAFRGETSTLYFGLWFSLFFLIMTYRVGLLLIYRKYKLTQFSLLHWDVYNFLSTLLTGLIWGLLALQYQSDWQVQQQAALWGLLVALMAGASASFSVVFRYYLAYCLPIIGFSLAVLAVNEEYNIATILFFFSILLSLTAINFNRKHNLFITQQLDLIDANKKLESLATNDSLTNLPNRRAYENALKSEWDKHYRTRSELSLIMLDVDFFKSYNDHFGHDKGDHCLQTVADVLRQALLRPADTIARYGGEEFVILLPETSRQGALEVATRVHSLLEKQGLLHPDSNIGDYVTISIGIATLVPEKGLDGKILQLMADRELYKAKANGRNQTSYSSQLTD